MGKLARAVGTGVAGLGGGWLGTYGGAVVGGAKGLAKDLSKGGDGTGAITGALKGGAVGGTAGTIGAGVAAHKYLKTRAKRQELQDRANQATIDANEKKKGK